MASHLGSYSLGFLGIEHGVYSGELAVQNHGQQDTTCPRDRSSHHGACLEKREPGEQFTGPTEMDHRCQAIEDHHLGSLSRTEATTSLGPV
jgi:hypothetical protein